MLDWHRREDKATWWEYFRLSELTAEELIHERAALSGLTYIETIEQSARGIPTDRYRFTQQDTDLRGSEPIRQAGGDPFGTAVAIDSEERTIDIKKTGKTANDHPDAVFKFEHFNNTEQANAIFRVAQYVAEHGIEGDGPYLSARNLLLRTAPKIANQPMRMEGEKPLEAALRIANHLEGGVLPIQGPPGTGKTYTGARMICRLVERGLKVGITANSHKVIRNLLDKVVEASIEMGVDLTCIQKPKEMERMRCAAPTLTA